MTLTVGVIGTGNMGKHHARIYAGLNGANLVAVADIDSAAGETLAKKHRCAYYKNYRELLRRERPDMVSVCVPTSLHYAVARDVIAAGAHLLVEKPIARTLAEARKMADAAAKRGVLLTVGHVERFNPAVKKLKEIIDAGRLGTVTSLLARRVGLFPPQIKDANVVIDLAVHDIDVFNYLLGQYPSSVYARGGRGIIKSREDYAGMFLTYNGVNAIIEVNWITPVKIRVLNVTGTEGYASLNYITQDLILYESNYEKTYDRFGEFMVKFGKPKKRAIRVKKDEPLKLELEEFLRCVKTNREPRVTAMDGLRALQIALASRKGVRP